MQKKLFTLKNRFFLFPRIANLAGSTALEDTPIRKEIKNYIKLLILLPVTFATIILVLGAVYYPAITVISYIVGIFIASVPEGVLVAVSVTLKSLFAELKTLHSSKKVCLTLAAKRMADQNVLVKTLESVETLGSTR